MSNKIIINKEVLDIISCIKQKALEEAHERLSHLDKMIDCPTVFNNLCGIIYEVKGDVDTACSYYRAALVFDGNYIPADRNLSRITAFDYKLKIDNISYGIEAEDCEDENDYYVDFSEGKVGHIKRRL